MLNFSQLFNGLRQVRNKINPTGDFRVTQVVGLPYIRVLAVQLEFDPLTQDDAILHQVSMLFHDQRFAEKRSGDYDFRVSVIPGIYLYTHRPHFSDSRVQVRCSCADYYFTWWIENAHWGSNAGPQMELYVRKTPPPPEGYPFRNERGMPGACKHIARGIRYMVEKGLVVYP